VHNLEPHDANPHLLRFWRIYAGLIAHLTNGFVALSPSTVRIVRNHFSGLKEKPAIFVWHPPFVTKSTEISRISWRERHKVDPSASVLAFIGHVRPYKGIRELLFSFGQTTDPTLRLVVAGMPIDPDVRTLIECAAGQDKRIILDLRWLPETDLQETLFASDFLVLPFRQTLHSGSIIYGLCCGKVVITPATAYANDLQLEVGTQWLKTYEPPFTSETLSALCIRPEGRPNLDFLSIIESGSKLEKFYRMLCNTA
jgi:beta-1,4-mannosyltransferase